MAQQQGFGRVEPSVGQGKSRITQFRGRGGQAQVSSVGCIAPMRIADEVSLPGEFLPPVREALIKRNGGLQRTDGLGAAPFGGMSACQGQV